MWEPLSFLKQSFRVAVRMSPQKSRIEFISEGRGVSPAAGRGRCGAGPPAWLSGAALPQTVQILIGLIHLGFGSVLLMVRRGHVGMLFIEGGVPFWGGACVSAGAI